MDTPWRRLLDEDEIGPEASARACDWPGCEEAGEHRAPKSREEMSDYHWFCQPHAREYNAAWNYYDGMSEDEVEADRRKDTTWQRPSWHFGTINGARARAGFGFGADNIRDDFGVYEEHVGGTWSGAHAGTGAEAPSKGPAPGSPEAQALQVLDLHPPISTEKIKGRYKEMVKRYHPDANGGDKVAEEKFKQIGEAYRILMAAC